MPTETLVSNSAANETPRSVSIELPFLPPPELRGNARPGHWAVRHKAAKALKLAAWFRIGQDGVWLDDARWMERATVLYDVWYCGKPIDEDNLVMGMKPALDAFQEAEIIQNDSPDCVQGISVVYHRVPHRDQVRVRITVEEVA